METPEEMRLDVGLHRLYKQDITALFYVIIINLDAGSNLCMEPEKELGQAGVENKLKYPYAYLKNRHYFTPLV